MSESARPLHLLRAIELRRADYPGRYPTGYWTALIGLDLRIPALVEGGRLLAGYLVAVEETEETINLTFRGLAPEE